MAVVTLTAAAPAMLRIQDIFSATHSAFTYTAGAPTDQARTINSNGRIIDYFGNDLGSDHFQFTAIQISSATDVLFRWEATSAVDAANLVTFHRATATSPAAIMAGDDQITGNARNDFLEGFAGNDIIDGGAGNDRMAGGAGDDVYYVDDDDDDVRELTGQGFDTIIASANFGLSTYQEIEVIKTANALSTVAINLSGAAFYDNNDTIIGNCGTNVLSGGRGDDYLFSTDFAGGVMLANAGNDTLNGGDGNDGLFAGDGADILNGGDGNDGLVGGAGGDTLNGGNGVDFLFGGGFGTDGSRLTSSGDDTLNGANGNDGLYGFDGVDKIDGVEGNDYVEGGAGNDTINGGGDSDFLLGEGGADIIRGGTGYDYLYGGTDADIFIFGRGDSADWILDFNAAELDKLQLAGFGYTTFAAVPFVDKSSASGKAVGFTVYNTATAAYDDLTIFGVSLAELNSGNVLLS